jgi:glycosyltransferase involved in cell wall biosynthesis
MKIVVFHQNYLSAGQPGGSRFNEFARLWAAAGHEVTVIAGTLNYTTGAVPEHLRGRWIVRDDDGPVRVVRCYVPTVYHSGRLGRSVAYWVFAASALTAAAVVPRPDVAIVTSPPLNIVVPGHLAARYAWRGVPWVFEVRDLWPGSVITSGLIREGSLLARLLYAMERWASERATLINVLTPAFRDDIVSRGLAPDDKIVFVPNGADVSMFSPGPRDNDARRELGWGDKTVFLYAGAHGVVNALDQLVDAAALLRDRPDIHIACVGDGTERARLTALSHARGLDNITFHGPMPKARMPEVINAADVGVAVLQDNPMMKTVYPNKVFDYMACARPTLLAIDGVARKLVCDDARAGRFVRPQDPHDIANGIRALADDPIGRAKMGEHGRAWVLANATRESLAQRYLDILTRLATH